MVLINEELKDELLHLYDKDSRIVMVLSPIAEGTGAASSGSFVTNKFLEPMSEDDLIKRKINEMDTADAGNIGYDNPGFVGISRDGKFPTNPKPTKAQKNTQWAGGAFVEFDHTSKSMV